MVLYPGLVARAAEPRFSYFDGTLIKPRLSATKHITRQSGVPFQIRTLLYPATTGFFEVRTISRIWKLQSSSPRSRGFCSTSMGLLFYDFTDLWAPGVDEDSGICGRARTKVGQAYAPGSKIASKIASQRAFHEAGIASDLPTT